MKRCLVAATVGLLITGCDRGPRQGEPVDYGPSYDPQAITTEVAKLVRDSDPSQAKVGAFGRFFTTVNIGGGTLESIVANTSHEVISRTVNDQKLTLQILEKVAEYKSNSTTPEKMSRIFQFNWDLTPEPTPAPTPGDAAPLKAKAAALIAAVDPTRAFHASFSRSEDTRARATAANTISYHGLRAWEDSGPPPERVRSAPDCLGLPKCQLRLRHVTFDIVTWEVPEGNRIHIELMTSPDIPQIIGLNMNPIWPFIPGLMKSCISRMIPIDTNGRSKTLVTECNQVVSFAFDASQFTESSNEATP